MWIKKNLGIVGVVLAMTMVAGLVPWSSSSLVGASTAGGLLNAGFEEGILGGYPVDWNVPGASDTVKVVGPEGPDQFPAYTVMLDEGEVVEPYRGDLMLRLGSPKGIAESQPVGQNTVRQTFVADRDTLLFSFRLFSWEFRGQDVFSFDLTMIDPSTKKPVSVGQVTAIDGSSPLLVTMPDGTNLNLSTKPRTWSLDVGKRGQYLASDWIPVRINDVPVGPELTLSYTVGGTKDSAHATWGYFDNFNTPPVAKFSFGPLHPLEGDIVQLLDGSYDPDPGDRIVSWEWDVTWSISEEDVWHCYSNVRNPFFVPPDDDGSYSVSLTVTDTWGASTTITNGEVPIDGYLYYPDDWVLPEGVPPFEPLGHAVPDLYVENAPPKVNALNIEVLPGQTVSLFGRFLDPGWTDNHTAEWSISPSDNITLIPGTTTLMEDDVAFLETGVVTGKATVSEDATPGVYQGTLTVDDSDNVTSDDFIIRVLPPDLNVHEADPTDELYDLIEPTNLASNAVYLSYIQSMGDIDLFEVTLPNGQPLPAGSEILVSLKGLPADYDLVMFSQSGFETAPFQRSPFQRSPFQMSPFQRSPFQRSPFQMSPFQRSDYQGTPFQRSPFQRSPFQRSPFQRSPFQRSPFQRSPFQRSPFQRSTFDQYPLSDMGFTGLDANKIGGTDISLTELGIPFLGENMTPVGFSANRGLKDETLLVRSELDGTRFFIAVLGVNEVFSEKPYQLQIETSRPLDLLGWLSEEPAGFTYQAPVDSWESPSETVTLHEYGSGDPLTLFVTQRERIIGLYGQGSWDTMIESLELLADNATIRGDIISVPLSIYETADKNTDNVAALNEVAESIRTIVQTQLSENTSIQYVVFVGSDDVIPYYRVPDETTISNERSYLMSSFVTPGSPLFYSLLGGWNLTDDYYVDESPIPWQGRALYVPDLPIGRLVETPEEIAAAADAFLSSGGTLSADSALVTGYDFFADGSIALESILGADTALISDDWSSEDLRSALLSGNYDISAINAHFSHYAILSALGANTDNMTDIVTSEEVALASGEPLLTTVVMSMGCHAGLNVTDKDSEEADPGMGVDPALDFPQAMAQQGAIFVGSTGYGLGDDEGIGGTERLINTFAESLMTDSVSIGESLVLAKQRYLGGLGAMTVYDEKSSIQFTLYGLPQYQIEAAAGAEAASSAESALSQIAVASLTSASGDFVTLIDLDFQRVDTESGSYFTYNGDAQATAFRPIQPRMVLPIETNSDNLVHGVLLINGQYEEILDFDPVITRPTNEWEAQVSELQIGLPALWPATLASVNTLEASTTIQNLVVIPGQFRPTGSPDSENVTGVQRLYTDLGFELLRSTSTDFAAPIIHSIDLRLSGDTVNVGVTASDSSGIARVVVLKFSGGTVTAYEGTTSDGHCSVDVPATKDDKLLIQVVDGAGNVATATGKGAYLNAIAVDAGPDRAFGSYYPVTFTATISDFESLTEDGTAPVYYVWKFGDGISASGLLPADYPVNPSGQAVFSVTHTYLIPDSDSRTQVTATLKVLDMNGGIGVDDVVLRRIWDPKGDATSTVVGSLPDADLVGGYITNDAQTMTIGIRVDGVVNGDYQYRIRLEQESGGSALLKYTGGKVTGPPSLTAVRIWNPYEETNELRLTFALADIGLETGETVWFYVETQAGVPGTGSTGFVDRMPDSGSFLYIVQ